MIRTVLLYAALLCGAAFLLQWLEYRYFVRAFSIEIYVFALAVLFTGLGLWLGTRLVGQPREYFQKNEAALKSLQITGKEYEVLELLAAGHANKEIARLMGISPNTVKTHLARLYDKLDVRRRTQAIDRARHLELIP